MTAQAKARRKLIVYGVVGFLVASFIIAVVAYNIGTSSKTFQFTHPIQERDASGTVVFYLVGGSNMSFTNEFTRENVQPMQMLAGGTMMVQYSFIGYPVQVDYVSR